MLYYMNGTFYFTSPELIKKAYKVRINDYLMEIRSKYMRLFPDDKEKILNEIIAGIQIPEIYKREAFVHIDQYLGDICIHSCVTFLRVLFPVEKFNTDYDVADKHFDDKHEDAEKLFFPTYDINHQGKVGSLEYKEIFEKSTGTTVIRHFLEMYGFAIPQLDQKDIIIKLDDNTSFMIKSDSTMQSYYNVMVQEREEHKEYYSDDRVFAIINGDVYHYRYSKDDLSDQKDYLGNVVFYEFAGGTTNKEIRKSMNERVNDFVERYFSIPDDAVVYTIPELEECLAPEI